MREKNQKKSKKLSAQITLETAIIFPIVIIITAMFIYLSFYIHDFVSVQSIACDLRRQYKMTAAEEMSENVQNRLNKTGLFLSKPTVVIDSKQDKYIVEIKMNWGKKNNIFQHWESDSGNRDVEIEKQMQPDIMYLCRVVCDEIKKRKEKE